MVRCTFALFVLFIGTVLGSEIRLTSSPPDVQPSLTKSLDISCSLHDTPSPSGALVGRSLTNTSYDVTNVTSILIKRDGSDVASITPNTPASSSLTNVKVSGEISGNSLTKRYLNISWTYPTEQDLGEFVCEINAISATGHSVLFSTSIQVNAVDTTFNDLIKFMSQMETRVSGLETQLKNNLNQLQTKDQQISQLQNNIHDLQVKSSQFSGVLNEVKKTEGGSIDCGSSGWVNANNGYWTTKDISIRFSNYYKKAPIVHLSFMFIDDDAGWNSDNEFGVEVVSVSFTNFTMRCKMNHRQSMQSMKAGWFSFPQF